MLTDMVVGVSQSYVNSVIKSIFRRLYPHRAELFLWSQDPTGPAPERPCPAAEGVEGAGSPTDLMESGYVPAGRCCHGAPVGRGRSLKSAAGRRSCEGEEEG